MILFSILNIILACVVGALFGIHDAKKSVKNTSVSKDDTKEV